MLKHVNNDLYGISTRIKHIFALYEVFYDTQKQEFCVYSMLNNGKKKFEFSVGKNLDSRAIKKCVLTSIRNAKKILREIDEANLKLENENLNRTFDHSKDQLKVYLNYANRKSCNVDFKMVNTFKWI